MLRVCVAVFGNKVPPRDEEPANPGAETMALLSAVQDMRRIARRMAVAILVLAAFVVVSMYLHHA